MTLIKCSGNCIYQKDGYCTNEEEKIPSDALANISLTDGCIYYTPKDEKITCPAH